MAPSPDSSLNLVTRRRALPSRRCYVTIRPCHSYGSTYIRKMVSFESPLTRLTCCFFRTIRYRSLLSSLFLTPLVRVIIDLLVNDKPSSVATTRLSMENKAAQKPGRRTNSWEKPPSKAFVYDPSSHKLSTDYLSTIDSQLNIS